MCRGAWLLPRHTVVAGRHCVLIDSVYGAEPIAFCSGLDAAPIAKVSERCKVIKEALVSGQRTLAGESRLFTSGYSTGNGRGKQISFFLPTRSRADPSPQTS